MSPNNEERISQALLWLGFEDVEIGKRFSAKEFENNKENVIESEITYTTKDNFIPKAVSDQLIRFLENVLNYHNKIQKYREELENTAQEGEEK